MVDKGGCGRSLDGIQKHLRRARLEASCVRERIPEGAYKGMERHEFLCTGRLMHTVQSWHAEPGKVCCDGTIGKEHALLDQHMCPGALGPQDGVDLALA